MNKTTWMAVGVCALLCAGCAGGGSSSARPPSSGQRVTYDPQTDTTRVVDGEHTWLLKGNVTNVILIPAERN